MGKEQKKKLIIVVILLLILNLTLVFYTQINSFIVNFLEEKCNIVSKKNNLLVHFIDVGQGDAMAINMPTGEVVLIDTGTTEYNNEYIQYLKDNVLQHGRLKTIDYLILTHAHEDHIGGAMLLLNTFNVKNIVMPMLSNNTDCYNNLMSYVDDNCDYTTIDENFSINIDNFQVVPYLNTNANDLNKTCPIIRLDCFNYSFLFTGDIDETIEQILIDEHEDLLDVDVLKVAHHGAKTSTCDDFLEVVTPDYSVISAHDSKHPTDEVLSKLENTNSIILRTDTDGNILFKISKHYGMSIKTGNYFYVTNLSLDYIYIVVIADCVLLIVLGKIIFIKKNKK